MTPANSPTRTAWPSTATAISTSPMPATSGFRSLRLSNPKTETLGVNSGFLTFLANCASSGSLIR